MISGHKFWNRSGVLRGADTAKAGFSCARHDIQCGVGHSKLLTTLTSTVDLCLCCPAVGVAAVELFEHPSKAEEQWMVFVLIVFCATFFYFSDRLVHIEKKVDDLKEMLKQSTK